VKHGLISTHGLITVCGATRGDGTDKLVERKIGHELAQARALFFKMP